MRSNLDGNPYIEFKTEIKRYNVVRAWSLKHEDLLIVKILLVDPFHINVNLEDLTLHFELYYFLLDFTW